MMVNRDAETPWVDFMARIKVGLLGAIFIFFLILAHVYWVQWTDSRSYRTVMGQIPFTDVTHEVEDVTGNDITLSGTFIKTRDCTLFGYPIFMIEKDGEYYQASLANVQGNIRTYHRPPSEVVQRFGPWLIQSPVDDPDHLVIYVTHTCDGKHQTNQFLEADL